MEIFEFFNYVFFYKALITSILAGISCGIIGVWILLLNISFIGIVIAYFSFAGIVIGLFFGISLIITSFVFCICATLIIDPISQKIKTHNNITTSLFFSATVAIALIFISLLKDNNTDIFSILWGNILISSNFSIIANLIATIVLILFAIFFNKIIIEFFLMGKFQKIVE